MIESVLIISNSDSSGLSTMLKAASIGQIAAIDSCVKASRLIYERHFDLVIVNSPLKDGTGERLSREISSRGESQVILLTPSEHFDSAAIACEREGVFVIAKPINRTLFWNALTLVKAAHTRVKKLGLENAKLKSDLEDIKLVSRAKNILISQLKMSESDAHKYIEKQAMDTRRTRRAIAEGIIKTYEN